MPNTETQEQLESLAEPHVLPDAGDMQALLTDEPRVALELPWASVRGPVPVTQR
jgi:hypothetical protein